MPPSRLFHAIVLMGCALAPSAGCDDPAKSECASDAGVDAADASTCHAGDGGDMDGGWPPTK